MKKFILKVNQLKIKYHVIILLFFNFLSIIFLGTGGGGLLHFFEIQYDSVNKKEINNSLQKIKNRDDRGTSYEEKVRMGLEIKIKSKSKIGKYIVENISRSNTRINFLIIDKKTDMILFESEKISPGYGIYEIVLEKNYPVGKHKVEILLKFYDGEEEISEESRNILINVLKS